MDQCIYKEFGSGFSTDDGFCWSQKEKTLAKLKAGSNAVISYSNTIIYQQPLDFDRVP